MPQGLGYPGALPEGGAPAPQGGQAVFRDDGEEPNVSPEEQAQYERFVDAGQQIIYGEALPQIEQRLQATQDQGDGVGGPVDDLANVIVMVVQKVKETATSAGEDLSPDVIHHGGIMLLEDLAEYAEAKGIHSFTEQDLEAAYLRALDLYRETERQEGRLSDEQLNAEFGQIVEANEAGQLEALLPGIEKAAGRGEGAAETGERRGLQQREKA